GAGMNRMRIAASSRDAALRAQWKKQQDALEAASASATAAAPVAEVEEEADAVPSEEAMRAAMGGGAPVAEMDAPAADDAGEEE
ncbi:MAG: hypothetical protein KDD98_08245, partial [Sphingomonadaceae bacterium]|nr:hypothetical protein [Sphingomonadaceae bacterium]